MKYMYVLFLGGVFSVGGIAYESPDSYQILDIDSTTQTGITHQFLVYAADSLIDQGQCVVAYYDKGRIYFNHDVDNQETSQEQFFINIQSLLSGEVPVGQFNQLKYEFINTLESVELIQLAEQIGPKSLTHLRDKVNIFADTEEAPNLEVLYQHKNACKSSKDSVHDFYTLRLTGEDQRNISELITCFGEYSWLKLLKYKKKMERLGDDIEHVHPLCFLAYIHANPSLKENLRKILGDFLKRKHFLDGFGKKTGFRQKMDTEYRNHRLMVYIPGFSQQVDISSEVLGKWCSCQDWGVLVDAVSRS